MNQPQPLSNQQWQHIEALLPRCGNRGGQWKNHRQVIDGVLWVLTTGAAWRELPERFGNWKTVYERYRRWKRTGEWARIEECLRACHQGAVPAPVQAAGDSPDTGFTGQT